MLNMMNNFHFNAKRSLLMIILVSLSFVVSAQQTSSYFIQFDHNSSALEKYSFDVVESISSDVTNYSTYKIEVLSHTDQDGTDAYNEKLALNRGNAVVDLLLSYDIDPTLISMRSFGEKSLLIDEMDNYSKAKNRRVEIIVDYQIFSEVDELIAGLYEKTSQYYNVPTDDKSTYELEKGSTINIPKNAFVYQDGTMVEGEVELEVIEAFTKEDFLINGLTTSSHGDLIESGGMLYFAASINGQELDLAAGKKIGIVFPEQEFKSGMELFYGSSDSTGMVDWDAANISIEELKRPKVIDWEAQWVLDFDVKKIDKPIFSIEKLSRKPKYRNLPYEPRKPIEPNYARIKPNVSKYKFFFMKKETKKRLVDEIYNEHMVKYQEKLDHYNVKLENYKSKKMEYTLQNSKVDTAIFTWNIKFGHKLEEIAQYKKDCQEYLNFIRLKHAKNYIKKNLAIKTNNELFVMYNIIMEGNPSLSHEYRAYRKALGPDYYAIMKERNPRIRKREINIMRLNSYNNLKPRIYKDQKEKEIEKKIAAGEGISNRELSQYVVSTSNLGWINCDRFMRIEESESMELVLEESGVVKHYLIFKDINSVLIPTKRKYNSGYSYTFSKIPLGKEIEIVSIKMHDAKPQIYREKFTIKKDLTVTPVYAMTSLEEIRDVFSGMN